MGFILHIKIYGFTVATSNTLLRTIKKNVLMGTCFHMVDTYNFAFCFFYSLSHKYLFMLFNIGSYPFKISV